MVGSDVDCGSGRGCVPWLLCLFLQFKEMTLFRVRMYTIACNNAGRV